MRVPSIYHLSQLLNLKGRDVEGERCFENFIRGGLEASAEKEPAIIQSDPRLELCLVKRPGRRKSLSDLIHKVEGEDKPL